MDLFMKYPHEVQEEVLHDLLNMAQDTVIGRQYDYKSIDTYETFASRVPLSHYEDLAENIEKSRQGMQNIYWPTPIKWFAKSSGTTNAKSKFIPVSSESLENCHYEASKDLLSLYLNNNPESNLFVGKSLRLGGSKELYQDKDTFFGDLSAILIDNMPVWAEFSSTPSSKISLMGDWETKLPAIINEAIRENVSNLAGVPSWMMVLLQNVLQTTGKQNILELWPNAEVYFHGGVSFEPYKEQYKKLFPSSSFKYYEIYNASEGFFAIQDQNNSNELLLMLDYGIFYEFIDAAHADDPNPKVLSLDEVEIEKPYALVISTNAGLWRYKIGDVIQFTNLSPYRIKISGRTKHFINTFGEELVIDNAEKALTIACEKTGAMVREYTAGPVYMEVNTNGAHEWMIEFDQEPSDMGYFSEVLDNALKSLNSDYEAKRYHNITLRPPIIRSVESGTFYQWMKQRGKLGAQNKVPRLSNDRKYLDDLLEMTKEMSAVSFS
jgi:hypothetical protein